LASPYSIDNRGIVSGCKDCDEWSVAVPGAAPSCATGPLGPSGLHPCRGAHLESRLRHQDARVCRRSCRVRAMLVVPAEQTTSEPARSVTS